MSVGNHIESLLHHHECVIIPDFGGFLVKKSTATYKESSEQFLPPGTSTQFHIHLRNNDGLLIQSIMESESISYDEAAKKVQSFTQECKDQLQATKSTIIPGVGKIYVDQENKVQFSEKRDANFNANSFGLPVIQQARISRAKQVEHQVEKSIGKRKFSPLATTFTVAASLLALLMASALFFLHQGNDQQQQFVQSHLGNLFQPLLVEEQPNEPETLVITPNQPVEEETTNEIDSTIKEEKKVEVLDEPEIAEETPSTPSLPTTAKSKADFHVIIGMFLSEENAQKRYQEALINGYSDTVIKKGRKYYRVMVPYSDQDATWVDAVSELRQNLEPEAWVWETLYQ